jgi:hypothetical protein
VFVKRPIARVFTWMLVLAFMLALFGPAYAVPAALAGAAMRSIAPLDAHAIEGSHGYGVVVVPLAPTGVRYATSVASGSGDCSSWANACVLLTALTGAASGDEIWVAAGTHKPTAGSSRGATFQLVNGVAVYGGFAGTETDRSERNPTINVTILSGDLNGDDVGYANNSENVYHVVTGVTGATLDGFTITAGNANVDDVFSPDGNGGGMLNNSGSNPTLANLIFTGNSTAYYGGGMLNWNSSSPTLTDVSFIGNFAASDGGGMFNWSSSSPTMTNITFSSNLAPVGGGMYNYQGSNPSLTNVTFTDNSATMRGGGMYNYQSSPLLTNVTFSGNSANSYGGGMYNEVGSNPQVCNSIFWGNTAPSGGAQVHNSGSTPVVSYSVVQDGYAGGSSIIVADPLLGMLGNHGGSTQTIPLLPGSSAIDTGNDAICPATDQRGLSRPQGAHCDIGAYELRMSRIYLPLVLGN